MINLFRNKNPKQKSGLLILFASQTGNAKTVAQQAYKYLKKQGLMPVIRDTSDFPAQKLAEYNQVLMVVSTSGQGGPPPSSWSFFRELNSSEMPSLEKVHYSVCALGDSGYKLFCEAGKNADHRMKELKAKCIYQRVDCDADFSEEAVRWIKKTYAELSVINHKKEPALIK